MITIKNVLQRSGMGLLVCAGLFATSALLVSADAGPNLISNPSLDSTTAGWSTAHTGNNISDSFTYPVAGVGGGKAVHAQITKDRNGGEAYWESPQATVTAGKQYQFSGYSRSNVSVAVVAMYTKQNGNTSTQTLGTVSGTGAWQQYATTITIPAGVTKVRFAHVLSAVGYVEVDNYSLQLVPSGTTPAPPVPAPKPTISSFTATPASILTGSSTVLAWAVSGASSTSIDQGVGAVTGSSKSVSPTQSVTYTLTAINPSGTATSSVKVSVTLPPPPPAPKPSCTLSANPTSIAQGSSTVLTFGSQNAASGSIDNGVGAVAASGTKTVSPSANTLYTGTFLGAGGTTTCSAQVTVTLPPPPPTPPVATSTGPNLIPNGTFEVGTTNNPTGWNADYWGTMTAKFTYPVAGHNGGKAAQIQVTKYTSGDAKWDFDHINVSSHTIYQFSDDYISTVVDNVSVEYLMQDGTYQYDWVADAPATGGAWQTLTAQITVPAGAVSMTVLHTIAAVGTLTTDNASLVAEPASPLPSGMVSLTFDDGDLSQYQNALPILTAAGMKASFYIITSEPGSGDSGYMTWAQIKSLASQGFEIGGHTQTHPYLTTLTSAQAQKEISGSFTDLVAQGLSPKTFVYPYGDRSPATDALVEAAGYIGSRGSYYGLDAPFTPRYNLDDIRVDSTTSLASIEAEVDQAVADKRWLVLEIHDVLPGGGDTYTITPAFFQSLVNYIKQSGAQVVTLQSGLSSLH